MSNADLAEAFFLICGLDGNLAYQSWIMQKYPTFKMHFTFNVTPREPSVSRPEESMTQIPDHSSSVHMEASINDRISQSHNVMNSQQKYMMAKQKIEQYILSADLNIGMMFAIMDTNSDSEIAFPEFKQKMRAMHIALDEEEQQAFFRKLDINNSGSIDFDEFVNEFSAINTEKIITKIKTILTQGKIDPEFFFNKHALADRTHQKMT